MIYDKLLKKYMARVQFKFLQGFQLQKHCFKTRLQLKGSQKAIIR